jgi:hypothetical protein
MATCHEVQLASQDGAVYLNTEESSLFAGVWKVHSSDHPTILAIRNGILEVKTFSSFEAMEEWVDNHDYNVWLITESGPEVFVPYLRS